MYQKNVLFLGLLLMPVLSFAADGVIFDFKGPVLINGKLANTHTPITFGDEVLTGEKGRIGIRLDDNVYRIGSRSRLALPKEKKNFTLNLFFGSILAVFRHDTEKTIQTPTAVLGVRGTGAYLRIDNKETYLCTCYGDIDVTGVENKENAVHIHAEYHNAITLNHRHKQFAINQAMLEHKDKDLFELEAIASRTPPESFTPESGVKNATVVGANK